MSSLFKRMFNSKSKSQSSIDSPSKRKEENGDNEQKKKKLLRRLALAENDPEPLLDLSDSELTKLSEQILTLIKVYHKHRVHLERNQLPLFAIPSSSSHFVDVTVLHLEDNQLCSLQLDSPSSLANLKELYLGCNKLSSLPAALFQLPRLQVLSLRENRLAEFPLLLVRLAALTYCDLGYNRICTLPSALLSADPAALGTLIVEGNPLSTPSFEYLSAACQDVTSFAQIDATLRQYYQVHSEEADEKKEKKGTVQSKQANIDFAGESTAAATRSKGDDDAEYDNEANDLFARYAQKKFESKQNAIEWERNYMNAQLEQRQDDTTEVARVTFKDKLLHKLHKEQDSLFAKINQFNDRKDVEKQRMLDNCIEQLQAHSSLLIEKLTQDIARQKAFDCGANEHDLDAELNADIFSLLAQYDAKLSLKRNVLLTTLAENHQEEGAKLAESFQRKDDQHQSLFKELERQEESLSQAFDTILAARDRRNEDLSEKISLVEQELLALTFVERKRKDERCDLRLADLKAQRGQLAQLLASLLEVKRQREKQLKETLEKELAKRYCQNDGNAVDSWLEEFQRLLSKESFEVQVNGYGIDARIADILVGLYHELEDEALHAHGSMLQGKLIYYLGHFVDISIDRLRTCSQSDLMRLHIDDYELCNLIVERFRRYSKLIEEVCATDGAKIVAFAPVESIEPNLEKSTQDSSEVSKEGGEKFWCEAECVICLDNTSNIVFLPCGHICTCQRCIRPNACPLSLCPLCRAEIDFMQSINI